jgi:hypothetical protein
MTNKIFPINSVHKHILKEVVWSILAPNEPQALKNHNQSLQHLVKGCGLSLDEIVAILDDRPWKEMTTNDALAVIIAETVISLFPPPQEIEK